MNADSGSVTGIPGMADGQVTATLADAWFDEARTARIHDAARRIERLHRKATKRLTQACVDLDEALHDHPLETRLRSRLLAPLQRECADLEALGQRVHMRLSMFVPAHSQARFEQGMALQMEDIQAERDACSANRRGAGSHERRMPLGYWMSEDAYNRLERACSAALLLSSMGEGIGESMAISFDSVAASAAYVYDDLAAVVSEATHSSGFKAFDESA